MRPMRAAIASFSSLAAMIATVATATSAHAWCRTTTNKDFVPDATTGVWCDTTGIPLTWTSSTLSFDMQKDASAQVDLATATALAEQGFSRWSALGCVADTNDCTGTVTGSPSISVDDYGPIACDNAEYDKTGGNANIIIFRDGTWPHDDSTSTLALTTVTYDTGTGEIYDADIEVNSNPSTSILATSDPVGENKYDLQSIFQHEEGHFLGLAHTQGTHTDATMYFAYNPGETNKRHPTADDACGLCNIYPPGRSALCDSEPRRGWANGCNGTDVEPIPAGACDQTPQTGCKCSQPGAHGATFGAGILGSFAIALTGVAQRRRRRSARR